MGGGKGGGIIRSDTRNVGLIWIEGGRANFLFVRKLMKVILDKNASLQTFDFHVTSNDF